MAATHLCGIPKHHPSPLSSPPGFKPLEASDHDLVKYGFPRRPDKKLHPKQAAIWKKAISRATRHVHTEPKLVKRIDPRPAKPGVHTLNVSINSGAGARLTNESAKFRSVSASWVIPNPYPPPGSTEGEWWVGTSISLIDSRTNTGLLVGTQANVGEGPGNSIGARSCWGWYQVLPSVEPMSLGPAIGPGDTVNVLACNPRSGVGWVSIMNVATGIVNTLTPALPADFAADTLYWGLSDPEAVNGPDDFHAPADFATQVIFDAVGGNPSAEFNLNSTGVELQDWVLDNTKDATTEKLSADSLLIYSYGHTE